MTRIIQIAILMLPVFLLTSCTRPSDNNLPDNLTIKDLAPATDGNSPEVNRLKTMNLDLNVLEIPAENFIKLDDIRRALSITPLKFNNQLAFSANSFSAYYGRNQRLGTVYDLLQIAGAQNVTRAAILLPDGESNDMVIKELPQIETVSFTSLNGAPESARIGPGFLAMHISVEKSTALKDAATVTISPIYTVMSSNTIPQYRLMEKMHDFLFTPAEFRLDMRPGDFIFLAPERLVSDQSTLSGLFFCNPYGSVFMNYGDNRLPQRKPAVRVYVIACVGLNF